MIKIIIVDDHQIVIDGLTEVLNAAPEIEIIGEALDGTVLLNQLKTQEPDLILLDINMPVMDGIETAKTLRTLHPTIKILVLTTHVEKTKIKKMIKVGVDGYLLKNSGRNKLVNAIKNIMQDVNYYDPQVINLVMSNYKNAPSTPQNISLTKRELQVTRLIAQSKTSKDIAEELSISPLTVETHRKNIFSKLGINKSIDLVNYAYNHGLMD
ncbi:MAG: response regulator [Aureispira sp.]